MERTKNQSHDRTNERAIEEERFFFAGDWRTCKKVSLTFGMHSLMGCFSAVMRLKLFELLSLFAVKAFLQITFFELKNMKKGIFKQLASI